MRLISRIRYNVRHLYFQWVHIQWELIITYIYIYLTELHKQMIHAWIKLGRGDTQLYTYISSKIKGHQGSK